MPGDPTKPLLKFDEPVLGQREKKGVGYQAPKRYGRNAQEARLGPRLAALRAGLRGQNPLQLRNDPTALAPECLIVFELSAPLLRFTKAVERVAGLEITGEDEGLIADGEEDEGEKSHLYLLFPRQAALEQLLSLWDRWINNQELGENNEDWAEVFDCLHDLRRWDARDRVSEEDATDIREMAAADPNGLIRIELELAFTSSEEAANRQRNSAIAEIQRIGGQHVAESRIGEIAYDALLVDIPAAEALSISERQGDGLAGRFEIFLIRPQSILEFKAEVDQGDPVQLVEYNPAGTPVAAILDAVPIQNHEAYRNHIVYDDPDGLQAMSVGPRVHGTAMLSLIVRGDLNRNGEPPLGRQVLFHPLMYAPDPAQRGYEIFRPGRLIVKDFVRAVRRLKAGENGEAPTGPDVLIVNVSLGDLKRVFSRRASAWARALDWLADEYGLLFIVSAGNAAQPRTNVTVAEAADADAYRNLGGQERANATLKGVFSNIDSRRLLGPAESVNSITVGALHSDEINHQDVGNALDPYPDGVWPTMVSRMGLGIGRSIKPDILMPGGKLRVTPHLTEQPAKLSPKDPSRFGGLRVAGPGAGADGLPNLSCWSGATSAAAALTTRAAHRAHDALAAAYPDAFSAELNSKAKALVLKALLVHRARVPLASRIALGSVIGPAGKGSGPSRQRAANANRFFGWGVPDVDELIGCLDSRATLWGVGSVAAGDAVDFSLPLPPCLSGKKQLVRLLNITLAWFSPILPGRAAYRSIRLTVQDPKETKGLFAKTVPSQVSLDVAERGTVFHRYWRGSAARAFQDGDRLLIPVIRKPQRFDDEPQLVTFGLAVSLETEDAAVPIYEEVKARVAVKPAVPVQIKAAG